MAGFWEDDEVKKAAEGGTYASLKEVGDTVAGTVESLNKRKFNAGKSDERVAIEVKFVDGPTLTAGQVLLMRALFELQPEVGDELTIELADVEKNGSKTLKKFVVRLTKADGTETVIDQTA